jgi:hypothetical protein
MASVTRAGILAIALTVGLSLTIAASPALAQKSPGSKCEKTVKKSVKKFNKVRLKKMQKCANKAVAKGTALDACFAPTTLKAIKDKACSSEALDDLGYKQECSLLNAACADRGAIADAASLTSCLECHLNQETRCMTATTYNATDQLDTCFEPRMLPGVAAAQDKDAASCLKKIDAAQKKMLQEVLNSGSADTTLITTLETDAACAAPAPDFDPEEFGYKGCPAIPNTDCDVASENKDLKSYLQCVACSVPQRLLPDPCGDGVVDPDIDEQCDPPGSIGGCPDCQVCKADCTCNTLPANASCPANSQGGPNLAAVTVVQGADLDTGWTGVAHNQGLVIGAQSFVCLDNCDLASDPECTGLGPFGNDQVNGPTFGPPLPLVAADVATCVINRFQPPGIQVRKLNLATGDVELAVAIESEVFATGNLQRPCPTCSGKGLGEAGKCTGFGPDVGKACAVEGITDFGNTSSSCKPSPGDNAGNLSIALDPVTSGEARLEATLNCIGGRCPCPSGGIIPVQMNNCQPNSPCLPPTHPNSKCPSDDVRTGVNSGIDQACCQTGSSGAGVPIIDGCFGEDRPGDDEDFDIVRNGTPVAPRSVATGQPWGVPKTDYPLVAKGGKVAGAFCIPPTNDNVINTPVGLGGPGTFILPGDACVGFLE